MGTKRREATRELQRIVALSYNPYFEEEVKKIRQTYRVPTGDLEKALNWYIFKYAIKYGKSTYPLSTPKSSSPWLEFLLGAEELKHIYDTEVPLEQDILLLLGHFQLPGTAFHNVLLYILTDDGLWLDPYFFAPNVEVKWDTRKMLPELTVTVTGLGPWATKKQWEDIWDGRVKQEVEIAGKACKEVYGTAKPGKKRATLKSYIEQMQRWSEWYQLSETRGLGPAKALDKWDEDHPDQYGNFDLSTVTHAIGEFKKIITPVRIED